MSKDTTNASTGPESFEDALTALLREGAQKLLMQAVEEEVKLFLEEHKHRRLEDGRAAVTRNGHLPERKIQTGIGEITVRIPKTRDRSGGGIKFTSALVPPYLKRTKDIAELLPVLYLHGISTGQYQEALSAILGKDAPGLSANTISRLKAKWLEEYKEWRGRDLSGKKYVYWWADGVYSNVRMDDKVCFLVIIGATADGRKELIAVSDGERESCASWETLMVELKDRGLEEGPKLAVGDGALGFWKALARHYPRTRHQRCWVHKTANVLDKLPKSMQPEVKSALREIYMAPNRKAAEKALELASKKYGAKYPKAIECLEKDREALLAFYDFPAEHWQHIRTTNPIESTFATIRLRTEKMRNCGSRETTLMMVFKLAQSAEKRWRRLRGHELLGKVIDGIEFQDGILAAASSGHAA